MKIVVIGSVAAGTSAAAKARRNDDHAKIVIYERDFDISYSGCGLPYYIGGDVTDLGELVPRDADFFKKKYNIDIYTGHEVIRIDPDRKVISVKNLITGEEFDDGYDKLVIATGASPLVPNVSGLENPNVFTLRNVQSAKKIATFIENHNPRTAVIVGTGFIGFEMLENLIEKQIEVTILEKAPYIAPNLDEDMSLYLELMLTKKKINMIKNTSVIKIHGNTVILEDGTELPGELVIMATGVKPNVSLAASAGITIGETGAIKVNQCMLTNLTDIYACGDCIETYSLITNKPSYRPLGSTANKTGRIAGDQITGGSLYYRGNLGTGIYKLFDMTVATTGLTEREARKEGYDIVVCHNIKPDKPSYFHGREMIIKAIADKETERLLGVQIIGYEGVDKRIDIFATLITYGAKVDELFHLDLAYAPPFSTTKDPVHYTGMILDNALNQNRPLITSSELNQRLMSGEEIQIIDTRVIKQYEDSHVANAINIPHSKLREQMETLDKDKLTVTYCNKGVTGNATQNILLGNDFKKVYNLSGGHKFYSSIKNNENKLK